MRGRSFGLQKVLPLASIAIDEPRGSEHTHAVQTLLVGQDPVELGVVMPRPPPGGSLETRQLYIDRVRVAYRNTLRRYRPRPYDGKVILLLSDSVPDSVASTWAGLTRGGPETHRIIGDHASYIRDHAVTTGTVLGGCLTRARESCRASLSQSDGLRL